MAKYLLCVLTATALTVCLSSCSKTDDESSAVRLQPGELAMLLGIEEGSGIEIGEILSDRNGVTCKSISLKYSDTAEVTIEDIELKITSPSSLVYAISFLRIGKLDFLDWNTSQRAQAYGIRVDKPAEGFLSKLETAIAEALAGDSLRTANLACSKLVIDRLDYVCKAKDATVAPVRIDGFTIVEATGEILGELTVERVGVGDVTTCKNLKLTKVDRLWADRVLAMLVGPASAETADTSSSSGTPGLSRKILPFDVFECEGINLTLSEKEHIQVADLRLSTNQRADGRLTRIDGTVNVSVSTSVFGREWLDFIRAMDSQSLEQQLTCSVRLKSVKDYSQNVEHTELSFSAPGLATVSANSTTRGLLEGLSALVTLRGAPADFVVGMSSIEIEVRDDGILAFLLSDRCKGKKYVLGMFEDLPQIWNDGAEHDRLSTEIAKFVKAPGVIRFSAESSQMMDFGEFGDTIFKSNDETGFAARLSFEPR